MPAPPTEVGRRVVYRGHTIEVSVERLRLADERCIDLDIVRHPGAAAVVALDDRGWVTLVRQYRHAAADWLLEVPAGTLDAGETIAACAARELAEETGLTAARWRSLGHVLTSPGFCDERIDLFLAEGLTPGAQSLDADELLTLEHMPLEHAVAAAVAGTIRDSKSVNALLRAHLVLAAG